MLYCIPQVMVYSWNGTQYINSGDKTWLMANLTAGAQYGNSTFQFVIKWVTGRAVVGHSTRGRGSQHDTHLHCTLCALCTLCGRAPVCNQASL